MKDGRRYDQYLWTILASDYRAEATRRPEFRLDSLAGITPAVSTTVH